MNCEIFADKLDALTRGALADTERRACLRHAENCADCRDALTGRAALRTLAALETPSAPPGLYDRVRETAAGAGGRHRVHPGRHFWLGAGFGGAVAASLLAVAMMLGVFRPPEAPDPAAANFRVAMHEARPMNLAIDVERPLAGATISILLSGEVEIDGYGDLRELTWSDDLAQGVNTLTLPVRAVGAGGGRMVVRLSHPQSERMFVVNLTVDG